MYLLYQYEPYYLRNCQESAEQQSESWLVQNLIFSQSSFWAAILITQASPNILKLCISGGGLWRSSVQKIGGSVYIIRFSNSESQSLSATCTSIEPIFNFAKRRRAQPGPNTPQKSSSHNTFKCFISFK